MDYADTPLELKAVDDAGRIEGLAAGIGDADRGRDTILPGAFTKTLAARGGRPIPMLYQHDQVRPIGVWTEWKEAAEGLHVKGRLTMAAPDAKVAHALARDGALGGLSIGYVAVNPQFKSGGGRNLAELDLHEASLVTFPMHPRSRIMDVKAITGAGDIADLLRERGVSGRQAKAAAGIAWKAINESTDDDEAEAEALAILRASAARIAAMKGL